MVLVAAGVLAVSLILVYYQGLPTSWRRMLSELLSSASSPSPSTRDDNGKLAAQAPIAAGRRPAAGLSAARDSVPAIFEDARLSGHSHEEEEGDESASTTIMVTTHTDHDIKISGTEQEEDDGQTTPKARPAANGSATSTVPTLSLAVDEPTQTKGASTTPSTSGAKPASTPASTIPTKRPSQSSASSLMPPPSVRPSALRPLPRTNGTLASPSSSSSLGPPPSAASSLRVPVSRGLPNSLATSARGAGSSSSASTSTLPPAARPSRKVMLSPGHSPLDWATLCRNPPSATFLRGADVPPNGRLLKLSPKQLRHYNGRKGRDAWGTYQGKVYNLTPYRDFHPGGVQELMRGAGRPGETERLFNEVHPWVNWDGMLSECLVGVLVADGEGEGEGGGNGGTDLDAMD